MRKCLIVLLALVLASCSFAERADSILFINSRKLRLFPQCFFVFTNEKGVAAIEKDFEGTANSIERERVSESTMTEMLAAMDNSTSSKDIHVFIYAENNGTRIINITYQQFAAIAQKAQLKNPALKQWIESINASKTDSQRATPEEAARESSKFVEEIDSALGVTKETPKVPDAKMLANFAFTGVFAQDVEKDHLGCGIKFPPDIQRTSLITGETGEIRIVLVREVQKFDITLAYYVSFYYDIKTGKFIEYQTRNIVLFGKNIKDPVMLQVPATAP